jgi:malate dehydrogenase (oxaloacetate-decarboxylating)
MFAMTQKKSSVSVDAQSLALHKKHHGKLKISSKVRITKANLPLIYTPGVGAVSSHLAEFPEHADEYTWRGNTVAVVSDGSAVLGLGNIGPVGALPVMEGKSALFQSLAQIYAVPIVLATQDVDEIVATVTAIAPSFGGINLEDISAPRCFEIETRLQNALSIPVMHDDQHGTAMVVLAGLINAHKVVRKNLSRARIAIIGAGSAGTAIAKLLLRHGVGDVVVVDRMGILDEDRVDLDSAKRALAKSTNREKRKGGIVEAVVGADAVVGVSGPGCIIPEHIQIMAQRPIVFALANPVPEIMPAQAYAGGAVVVATGRSDFPNQVNNALVFPGIFKGALHRKVPYISDEIKIRVAKKLAGLITHPTPTHILPSLFDARVVPAVASAVR